MAERYSSGDDETSGSSGSTDYNADGSGIASDDTTQKPSDSTNDFMLRPSHVPPQNNGDDSGDDNNLRDAEVKVEAEKVVIEGEVEGLEKEDPAPQEPAPQAGGGQGPPIASVPATGLGAAGPLTVDSVGDYLDDYDDSQWNAIDLQARQNAKRARQQQQDNSPKAIRERVNKKRKDAQQAGKDAKQARDAKRNARNAEKFDADDVDVDDVDVDDVDAGNDKDAFEGQARVAPDPPKKQSTLYPSGPPANEDHLASQMQFSLEHEGPKDSLTHARGQDQEAIHHAMDKATDAIKTSTGEIVHMLEEMSYVLRQHEYKIRHLMEIVDIEEKRSDY